MAFRIPIPASVTNEDKLVAHLWKAYHLQLATDKPGDELGDNDYPVDEEVYFNLYWDKDADDRSLVGHVDGWGRGYVEIEIYSAKYYCYAFPTQCAKLMKYTPKPKSMADITGRVM
jgi:hypothetical protein